MCYRLLLFCAVMLVLQGCSGIKNLPADKAYCHKHEIILLNPETVTADKKIKQDLLDRAAPELNSKFLGLFRIKLWLYTNVKEPKKKKGFRRWLKYKLGEEPAYYNSDATERATLVMEKYLEDKGYLRSQVEVDTTMKKNKTTVIYSATTEGRYFIRNVVLPSDTDAVSRLMVRTAEKRNMLEPGRPFNMGVLKAQRDFFATRIRSLGYYDFHREYLYYFVDTTVGNRELDIYFRVKQPTDSTQHTKYYLRDITVYPAYSIDDTTKTLDHDTVVFHGIRIIQPVVFLKKKAIVPNILMREGDRFSQKHHSYTVNRFLDLGIFKFVNIQYEKSGRDSLDVIIQLTPSETQDVVGEINLSTTTSNFLGTGAAFSYTNRNLFRGGEQLTLSSSVNIETQINSQQSFINTLELNARAELGFPRFILVFNTRHYSDLFFVPRTKFSISESYQRRVEYYTLNSVTADFAYDWRKNPRIRHIFTPVAVNSIRLFSTTPEFDEILSENPYLRASFEDVFIVTKLYSFIYNTPLIKTDKSYGYFRGNLDMAGNVIYTAHKLFSKQSPPYLIAGRPFAQYAKIDFDARYYPRFSSKHYIALRILPGIAIPFSNSEVTPYVKQFFIGGSTSVRAYRLRALGPGSYMSPSDADDDIFPDQTGDIKLEMNVEYRFTLVKFLKAAVFADAGNIWLLRKDPQRPGGEFEASRFYKEIAIGVGAGLRLDFNFFVIRGDVSFPIRRPDLPEDERWTFDKLYFGDRDWRQDNLIWHIAIGYPF